MSQLTHLDENGQACMVDVSAKDSTVRVAVVAGKITMKPETLEMIIQGNHKKGDVLGIARIAGIQAAKQCANLIPLCHPLMLSKVDVDLTIDEENHCVNIHTMCKLTGQTGVEMEALTAASVAGLTIYDMCKAVDKEMVIGDIRLLEKSGGRSGHFKAED